MNIGPPAPSGPSDLAIRPDAPWLAPLAGWSDLPFRLLCRSYGAAVCCTEMISAKGLIYGSPGTAPLLDTRPDDGPLVVQLFGAEAPFLGEAVFRLRQQGFGWFDCNMGCSVPKVTRTGSGAALLKRPEAALELARAMLDAAGPGRVGFKLRLGWSAREETWRELAVALEAAGAGWLTLHPRFAVQGFAGEARREALAELKSLVRIPVIASGDLFTAEDGLRCLEETGADAVMYARGALRDPCIFARHAALSAGGTPAGLPSLAALIRRHADLARSLTPEHTALLKMRTMVPRYARRSLRQEIIACRSWDEFERILSRLEEFEAGTV